MIGARLWLAEHDRPSADAIPLRIRNGRIHALGAEALAASGSATLLDLSGRVVIPGLIDAHVHLELDPAIASPADQLAVPEAARARAMDSRPPEKSRRRVSRDHARTARARSEARRSSTSHSTPRDPEGWGGTVRVMPTTYPPAVISRRVA